MADVQTFTSWSTTASSNKPAGTDVVGTGLADNFREIQAQVKTNLAHYNSTPVASASTVDLGAQTGTFLLISGTTTITAFGTVSAGIWKVLTFQGALTLTHNATSLILPGGANITTAAGDSAIVVSLGSGNWRCVSYTPADGRSIGIASDATFRVVDNSDRTKQLAFEVSGITTATTRTVTAPDYNVSLANVPIGVIQMYGGGSAPTGWLMCDGTAVSRSTYSALFSAIGTNYGVGDGSTTFNVPDFKGRSPLGKGQGSTAEGGGTGTNRALGASGGAETHTLTTDEMPSHTHTTSFIVSNNDNDNSPEPAASNGSNVTTSGPHTSSSTGGGSAHNNMSPFLVVSFIIRAL